MTPTTRRIFRGYSSSNRSLGGYSFNLTPLFNNYMIRKNTNQNKGQVGIGTLIVFIAIVLVAAVAASVIIEVSGILQDRAQQTSIETIEEVGDQLVVISSFGDAVYTEDEDEANEIRELRLNVRRSAGADVVNLDAVTIDYDSPDEQFFLFSTNSPALDEDDFLEDVDVPDDLDQRDTGEGVLEGVDASTDVGLFQVSSLVDQSGGLAQPPRSVDSRLDRGEISIPLDLRERNTDSDDIEDEEADASRIENENPNSILEDQRVQLTLSTGAGAETITTIQVPAVLTDQTVRLDR